MAALTIQQEWYLVVQLVVAAPFLARRPVRWEIPAGQCAPTKGVQAEWMDLWYKWVALDREEE